MDNLITKISKIREMVEALQKNKSGYGYKYVSEDEILAKVTAGLKKLNVDVYPKIVPGTMSVIPYSVTKLKVLKDGTRYEEPVNDVIVSAEMIFEWVNLEDPKDRMEIPWNLVGQQADVSQAFGSGLTYCMRYFFLKFFKSSTLESDPDAWRSKQQEAMFAEDKEVVQAIISEIDSICQANITEENKAGLMKILKTHVKKNGKASADYTAIEDPAVASRVLDEVKKYFDIDAKPKKEKGGK
ncbi:MAG: ERF family protein [Bacteroidales bacterium]|nr:ERF family protein [Bacteroidales bacterium]